MSSRAKEEASVPPGKAFTDENRQSQRGKELGPEVWKAKRSSKLKQLEKKGEFLSLQKKKLKRKEKEKSESAE